MFLDGNQWATMLPFNKFDQMPHLWNLVIGHLSKVHINNE